MSELSELSELNYPYDDRIDAELCSVGQDDKCSICRRSIAQVGFHGANPKTGQPICIVCSRSR